jgi:hypothetical protein
MMKFLENFNLNLCTEKLDFSTVQEIGEVSFSKERLYFASKLPG